MTNWKQCAEPRRTGIRQGKGVRSLTLLACAAALLAKATPQQEYDVRGTVADSIDGSLQNAMVVALSRETRCW